MKLWIDDVRSPPDDTWVWAKTSIEANNKLCEDDPVLISFDHDLGEDDTSMNVIKYIERWAAAGIIEKFEWQVHSMNPVGRENIKRAMERIEKFWSERK